MGRTVIIGEIFQQVNDPNFSNPTVNHRIAVFTLNVNLNLTLAQTSPQLLILTPLMWNRLIEVYVYTTFSLSLAMRLAAFHLQDFWP